MERFVRDVAYLLASKASELRPSSTAYSSSRAPSGFPTISDRATILIRESDDGRSQPQTCFHSAGHRFQEAVAFANINTAQEPGQVLFHRSRNDPLLCAAGNISDEWDPDALSNVASTPSSKIESELSLYDWSIMSPPTPLSQMPQSSMNDIDVPWLEQDEHWSFSGISVHGGLL